MAIEKIYAQVACRDLKRSLSWFQNLFGTEPDARPMTGLAEWRHKADAGLQLFENEANAGKSTVTLIVDDIEAEHARLADLGLAPPSIESGDRVSIIQLRDPDENLIVLAEPRKPQA